MRDAGVIDTHVIGDLIQQIARRMIRRWHGPHAAKRLARAAGVSARTPEGWLAGSHTPSTEAALALIARDPQALAELRADLELTARGADAARLAREALAHATASDGSILDGPGDGAGGASAAPDRRGLDRRRADLERAAVVRFVQTREVSDGV